jgi:hypothetical protein
MTWAKDALQDAYPEYTHKQDITNVLPLLHSRGSTKSQDWCFW